MKTTNCLDFCEIIHALYNQQPDFNRLIEMGCQQAGFEKCERIYFGSSFCGRYFLGLQQKIMEELLEVCERMQIRLSLVIPVFTEKYLERGKRRISDYSEMLGKNIDEIVVNDYGMMAYIDQKYGEKVKLFMGRLLIKDYREPRYKAYFNKIYMPKIFTSYLDQLILKYHISGMLFDATHEKISFMQKPEGLEIGIYEPYVYMTTGQICEMAGTHFSIDRKFRPNSSCREECTNQKLRYFGEEDRKWQRIGRTVYFENRNFKPVGLEQYRRIFNPFDQEEANEDTGSIK